MGALSTVVAAGAVLWRPSRAGTMDGEEPVGVAVVHRPRYDDWSFPKGKLERGETGPFAAVREVREETGSGAVLGPELGEVTYPVPEGTKFVRYWSARARAGIFAPNGETDELVWLPPGAAEARLTYRHDRDVLRRFTIRGLPASTVVLVRHAKAGSRSQWEGDDALRPLSSSGREQARRLGRLLPLFGPDRIVSAPPVRCRETLAPLAEAMGTEIGDEPLLGEDGWWDDPDAGLARFRQLAARPGVTIVGSQGGVIPDLVSTLVRRSPHRLGVDPEDVPARKASTWVLGFTRDGVLSSADHYPKPTG